MMNPKNPLVLALAIAVAACPLLSAAADIVLAPGDSLAKARDAAKPGDRIVLKGGTYRLNETLVLGPQHSAVTWIAAPGEKAVISGGLAVTGWTLEPNGLWQTQLKWNGKLRQLIVNGKAAQLAEGPTVKPQGWSGEFIIKGDEAWVAGKAGKTPNGFKFKKSDFPTLDRSNPEDVEFRQTRTWNHHWLCFRGFQIDGDSCIATFAQPAAAAATHMEPWVHMNLSPIKLFNAYEFVDAPGEFHYNTQTRILYYKPRPGESPDTATALAPQLETLVRIQGDHLQRRNENLRFEGITFADTCYQLGKIGDSRGHVTVQSNQVQTRVKTAGGIHGAPYPHYTQMDVPPAAVVATNSSGLTINRCTFRNLGCLALNLENDVIKASVVGNVFTHLEGGGINVGHPQHIYIGKMNGDNRGFGPYNVDNSMDKYDEAREGLCQDLTISNNVFRNVVTQHWGMVPISVFYGQDFVISHNDMENLPYTGISVGWGWSEGSPGPNKLYGAGKCGAWNQDGSKPSHSLRNYQVINNRIMGFCEKLHDGGGIYTLAYADVNHKDGKPKLYSKISGNYESTRSTSSHPDHCVYPDEGSSAIEISGNVFDIPTLLQAFQHQERAGKHDLIYRGNWINVPAESGKEYKNIPQLSDYSGNHYFKPTAKPTPKDQWPADAQKIIDNAGLEPQYRNLLDQIH